MSGIYTSSQFSPPAGYITPNWPSLYWPFTGASGFFDPAQNTGKYLYYRYDIWRFTTIWSVAFSVATYGAAGLWAYLMFMKSRTLKYSLNLIPIVFVLAGGISGFVSGSIVGLVLSLIYNAGFFRMSTWVPFLWGLINILIVVIGSYSTITIIL